MRKFCNFFQGATDPQERIPLLEMPDEKSIEGQLEIIKFRLQENEDKTIIKLSQKKNFCRFLFFSVLTSGTIVGIRFIIPIAMYYQSLTDQVEADFYNQPINNSTCHQLNPDMSDLEDSCYWAGILPNYLGYMVEKHFDSWEANIISFCSNLIKSYCNYKNKERWRWIGAFSVGAIGFFLGIIAGYFCDSVIKKEIADDVDNEVPNEILTRREKFLLQQEGILFNVRTSDLRDRITWKQIILNFGNDRGLYNSFGTIVKDYISQSEDDHDAYTFCSQFPKNR